MQGAVPSCTEITLADHVPDPGNEEVSELTISAKRGVILKKVRILCIQDPVAQDVHHFRAVVWHH